MPSGYIYNWTGKLSSAYGTAGNWYNTTAGATATAVPGTSDEALVVAAGSIVGPGAAFLLGLTGSGAGLSVGGTLYGSYAYVGGTVTLASGSGLASPNLIDIGDTTTATIAGKVATVLTVGSGSFLSATLSTPNTFDVLVGQGSGAHGTLAVNGTGIASAGTSGFWVGNGGNGVISISGGGQVDAGTPTGSATRQIDLALGSNGGTGTMIVSGTNSFANFTNTVEVGFGGTGVLSVSGGAFLDAGEGLNSLNIGDVYNGVIGSGIVTISASTAYLAGIVEVGTYGQGSLAISNGSTVDAYFYLPGTAPSWSALIGANAGSTGTLSISSQSTMLASEGVAVGSSGTGVLNVSSATLSIFAQPASTVVALDAGVSSGSVGTVQVNGGTIRDNGAAGIVIGGAGKGSLSVTTVAGQGGKVLTGNATGAALSLGVSAGSAGNVTVSGAGSGIAVSGEVADGLGGTGVIALSAQAQLFAGTSGTTTSLIVGGSGGSGVLSLASGSALAATGQMLVGEFGPGALSVTGGSGLTGQASGLAALVLGVSSGSTGTVLVSDASSFASLAGGVIVGSSGVGIMTVQNQALVTADDTASANTPALLVGSGAGSSGTVTLASQAEFSVVGAGVVVGVDGTGVLSVNTNAILLEAASPGVGVSALNIGVDGGASGTVDVSGGLIDDTTAAGVIVGDGGSGVLSLSEAGGTGGMVWTGNPTGTAGLSVGVASGSSGNVQVDGSASGLSVYGTADIGVSGQGNLALTNGGHFAADLGPGETGLVLGGSGGQGTFLIESGGNGLVVGQSIIGSLGVGAMAVTGGSSFTGTASGVPAMVIGASSTATGSVLISDAASYVPLTGGLVVGSNGYGILQVQSSAILAVNGSTSQNLAGVIIGQNGGSRGIVSVSGGAEALLGTGIAVGSFGNGTLAVTSATLAINASSSVNVPALDAGVSVGSSGVVNVAGGLVEDNGAAGMVIGDIGTGTLAITAVGSKGGTVLTGNPSSTHAFLVGNAASATGSVSVKGAGSGLGVYGTSVVGASGVGSLTIGNNAGFATGDSASGTGLVLGSNVGGIGSVALSGGAVALVTGQTDVGLLGSGFLSVTGGSGVSDHATTGPALVVAGGSGSTGNVLIDGNGSYLSLTGGLEVGGAGSGVMTVQGGALVSASGTAGVVLGADGGNGTLTVTGAGSQLVDTGFFRITGVVDNTDGNGTLLVAAGASVVVNGAGAGVQIGANGSASATVTGAGSRWTINGTLGVGPINTGTDNLTVAAGGTVTAGAVMLDTIAGGVSDGSNILVTGAGSALDASSLQIGEDTPQSKAGTLTVQSGGLVSATGSIFVYGTASLNAGTLSSGGVLTIDHGSSVSGNGTLEAASIVNLGTISVSSGTLSCLGNISQGGSIAISGGGALVVGNTLGNGQLVGFGPGGGSLVAQSASDIAGTLSGWSAGDFLDLKNTVATSESFANGTLSLFGSGSQLVGTIAFASGLATHNFTLTALAGGGTSIGYHS